MGRRVTCIDYCLVFIVSYAIHHTCFQGSLKSTNMHNACSLYQNLLGDNMKCNS